MESRGGAIPPRPQMLCYVRTPPPQPSTAPGDPHCGRKGYAWASPAWAAGDRDARGFIRYFFLPPHSGGYTRVPPVQPGPRRDRDAPWVPQVFFLPPHSGGYTRVPPVQPGPRGDRDAPWVPQVLFLPPHSGGYTRVPPVQPGPRRDRDAPWVHQVFLPSPTQRRLHPSPSGPAWAAEG